MVRVVVGCVAVAVILIGETGTAARQAGTRTVYVAAVASRQVPVKDMTAADFVIKEDGKVRQIANVEIATAPMSIALMLDNGGLSLGAIRQGAGQFIQTLQGKAEFAIMPISERRLTLVDFTRDVPLLYRGLQQLLARNTTTVDLLDAFVEVAQSFQKREAQRAVIVAVAAEGEELSHTRAQVVIDAIQKSGARVYYIGLGPPVTQRGRSGIMDSSNDADAINRNAVLGAVPKNSGGRGEQALQASGITTLMQQFADELAAQYAVTYSTDVREAKLSVETKRKGVTLRAPARVGSR